MNEEAKFAQAAMKTFGRGNKALNGEYSKANNAKPPGKYGVVWKRPAKVKPIYEKRPVYETRKRIVKEKYMDEIEEEYETNEVDHNRPIFKDSSTIQKGKLKKNKEYAWKAGFGYAEIIGYEKKKAKRMKMVEKEREKEIEEQVLIRHDQVKVGEEKIAAKEYYGKLGEKKEADPKGTMAFGFKVNYDGKIDGPTVTFDSSYDDSWDFSMTLSRDLQSSTDPAIPGRPGDTILGGGFEIVYVKTDTLDIRPKGAVFAEGEQESEWFDCTNADDIKPDVVILRGAGIDDSVAYSHRENREYTRDKIIEISGGNRYFVAVNAKNEEKKDYCYSVRLKITEEDKGGKKQCKAEFEDAKKRVRECSKYHSGNKTFAKPTEPTDAHDIATTDGAKGIGLKELFYASKSGDSKPPKCLTVVPEIQWRPRVPTSYVSSIFTIESKIIPELKDLIKVSESTNSLMTDGEISNSTNLPRSFESERSLERSFGARSANGSPLSIWSRRTITLKEILLLP